jgi:hypothetical protein
MKDLEKSRHAWGFLHFPAKLAGVMVLLLFTVGILFAGDNISASIVGNTINYSVTGVAPNADFGVGFKNLSTNQKEGESEHSDDNGQFSGSHTMGSGISPGTIFFVCLRDKDGNIIDFEHITKPMPKTKSAPWWAYTGIGTAIYFIF